MKPVSEVIDLIPLFEPFNIYRVMWDFYIVFIFFILVFLAPLRIGLNIKYS